MQTLLLDCDGVLADTEAFGHLPAFNDAFEELGLGIHWSLNEYAELVKIGGGKERILHYLHSNPVKINGYDLDSLTRELHSIKTKKYIDLIDSGCIPGRPGIRRLVDEAKAEGWTVAVASTSAVKSVQAVIDAVLSPGSIDAVFAGDMVKAKKPAPDIYLMAMERVGAEPRSTIVIEDSATGAAAAHNAGLSHLVTHSAFSAEEEFPFASLIVSDLGELEEPPEIRGGLDSDVTLESGMVTVKTLERLLDGHSS